MAEGQRGNRGSRQETPQDGPRAPPHKLIHCRGKANPRPARCIERAGKWVRRLPERWQLRGA